LPLGRQGLRYADPVAAQGTLRRSIAEHALLLHGIVVGELSLRSVDDLLRERIRVSLDVRRSQWLRGIVGVLGRLLNVGLRKTGTLVDISDAKVLLCIDGGNQFSAVGLIGRVRYTRGTL
jgi:hypothetical protein